MDLAGGRARRREGLEQAGVVLRAAGQVHQSALLVGPAGRATTSCQRWAQLLQRRADMGARSRRPARLAPALLRPIVVELGRRRLRQQWVLPRAAWPDARRCARPPPAAWRGEQGAAGGAAPLRAARRSSSTASGKARHLLQVALAVLGRDQREVVDGPVEVGVQPAVRIRQRELDLGVGAWPRVVPQRRRPCAGSARPPGPRRWPAHGPRRAALEATPHLGSVLDRRRGPAFDLVDLAVPQWCVVVQFDVRGPEPVEELVDCRAHHAPCWLPVGVLREGSRSDAVARCGTHDDRRPPGGMPSRRRPDTWS